MRSFTGCRNRHSRSSSATLFRWFGGLVVCVSVVALAGCGAEENGGDQALVGAHELYASPSGSGSACSSNAPCNLNGAQQKVRQLRAAGAVEVRVHLADGTCRLPGTWTFGPADSGAAGHPVVWTAISGAHPVISGATQIKGWSQSGTSGLWPAPVPAGSRSRQLYINGVAVPVAQQNRSSLASREGGRVPSQPNQHQPGQAYSDGAEWRGHDSHVLKFVDSATGAHSSANRVRSFCADSS